MQAAPGGSGLPPDLPATPEMVEIYLPLSRLLEQEWMTRRRGRGTFILGIAGSVSVGKTTFARRMQQFIRHWAAAPKVELVATDSFLLPMAVLIERDQVRRRGFPESYDTEALRSFLQNIRQGRNRLDVPVYSHQVYDILPDNVQTLERPDVLILEGLNVLQPNPPAMRGPPVRDILDFSIYLDAAEEVLEDWFISRFLQMQEAARHVPGLFFHKFRDLNLQQSIDLARDTWREINLINLRQCIAPTRPAARLILTKAADHTVSHVHLR